MKLPDDERILIVRPCLKTICLDVRPAAKLLSLLLFYARNCSEQEVTYTFSCTQEDLIEGLIDEMDVKTLHRIAIPMLRLLGYLDVDGSSYRYQYTVHLDLIQHVLLHYKDRKQLDKILIVSMKEQLDKCPIQIDKSPIELVKCPIELDKLLIPFRQMSNSKRGRKPRPQVPLGDVSGEDRLLQIDSDITDKEESNGEHIDTLASPHVDALSLSNNDTHSQENVPIADSNTTPSEGDDHAHLPSGSALWDGALPASSDDRNVPPLDDRQVAASETRPVLEAGKEEIEGETDHAQPLQPVPTANHPDSGSSDVPSRYSQVDSTGSPGALDAPSVDCAEGSDADGGEGQRGLAEDTESGIGSRTSREADATGDTARGQITEGDDHGLVDMDAARLGQHSDAGDVLHRVRADVRTDEVRGTERERAGRDIEQTASREDALVVAASPLPSSTVEPGESGRDTLPEAPVSAQQGDDMFNQPQMHVLVTSQQFTSVEEWEQGRKDFHQALSHAWKTASSDFKQQFGNWNGYRKHYGARWLKANPKPADVLPVEVQRILDDWKSLHRKVIPVTKSDIDAAAMLAPCNPTQSELSACRKWHFATDDPKKPWYRKIGVSLMDVANHWSKWQSLQDADDSRSETKTTTRTLTREELKRMPV